MNKRMDGPVQVMRPQAIPIVHRDLYRKSSHGSSGRGSHGSWTTPQPEGLRTSGRDSTERPSLSFAARSSVQGELALSSPPTPAMRNDTLSELPSAASLARFQRHNLRRIFVQTETGEVVVVEVDCATGGAEKVKRSVQAALNVPTEQADLMFGGHVLEDLHELQNDVPVLLRRGITRSASSPCLAHSSLPTFPSAFSEDSTKVEPVPAAPALAHSVKLASKVSGFAMHVPEEKALFELVGGLQASALLNGLVRDATAGVKSGAEPVAASGGTGGAYYFMNAAREKVVIVKPTDEEPFAPNNPNGYVGRSLGQPGLKKAIRVGEAGLREVAAFLLDHNSFAGVPCTALVKAAHPIFNVNHEAAVVSAVGRKGRSSGLARELAHSQSLSSPLRVGSMSRSPGGGPSAAAAIPSKLCSLQQYVHHDYDTSECGTSRFPVSAVHRIGILDVRVFNTDRHSGNILVRRMSNEMFERRHANPVFRVDEAVELVPIDHGFCLPETLEAAYFEWLHWPQASLPFTEEELEYIAGLDVRAEVAMLREQLPMIREGSLRVLVLSTTLLQKGAAAGLTLAEIGAIMSRDVRGTEEVASELEFLCLEAVRIMNTPLEVVSATSSVSCASEGEGFSGEEDDILGMLSPSRPGASLERKGWGMPVQEGTIPSLDWRGCASPLHPEDDRCDEAPDSPGLFFQFDDPAGHEDSEVQPQPGEQSQWGFSSKVGPGLSGGLQAQLVSKWCSPRGLNTRPHLQGSRVSMRLDFSSSTESPRVSALSNALRQGNSLLSGTLLQKPVPMSSVVGAGVTDMEGARSAFPCHHESLVLKRFRQSGPAQQPLLGRASGALSGLKLGSAGVAGSRLKALVSNSAEECIDGALPGGASFLLSDMEEPKWQHFFEVYVDLLEELVCRKGSERSSRPEFFGTSCQW